MDVRIFVVSSVIFSIIGVSFFNTTDTITKLTEDKHDEVLLASSQVLNKIDKEKRIGFLSLLSSNLNTSIINWKHYNFNKNGILSYGAIADIDLNSGKQTIVLNDYVWYSNIYDKMEFATSPSLMLLTRKYNNWANTCSKWTTLELKVVNNLYSKLRKAGIDLVEMKDKDGNLITIDQMKVIAWLDPEESKALDIFFSDRTCLLNNVWEDIKEFIFLPTDFIFKRLKKRITFIVSNETIDIKRSDGTTIWYAIPKGQLADLFNEESDGSMDKCIVWYSVFNLCIVE